MEMLLCPGDNYAAKVMHGKGELRQFMNNELDIMSLLHDRRLIRIHDAFETPHSVTLITELYPFKQIKFHRGILLIVRLQ